MQVILILDFQFNKKNCIKYLIKLLLIFKIKNELKDKYIYSGDWGLGIGDWGLGIGDWAQSPIPNPHYINFITYKKLIFI